jgi:hypothetical protein
VRLRQAEQPARRAVLWTELPVAELQPEARAKALLAKRLRVALPRRAHRERRAQRAGEPAQVREWRALQQQEQLVSR